MIYFLILFQGFETNILFYENYFIFLFVQFGYTFKKKEGIFMIISHDLMKNPEQLKEVMELICNNMIANNPQEDIVYRPYKRPDFIKKELGKEIRIDLEKLFCHAQQGDYTYVEVSLLSQCDARVSITLEGVEKISVNGNWYPCDTQKYVLTTTLRKGYNEVIFKCRKTENDFGMSYMVSYPCYTFLWTCDYILWVRDTSPLDCYKDEQGFTVTELVPQNEIKEPAECGLVWPSLPQEDKDIDFSKIYADESGRYAVSYTQVKEDGVFELDGICEYVTIYVNGEQKKSHSFNVKAGEEIFVVSERNDKKWGFTCCSNELLHLPFVTSNRTVGNHWVHIGLFDSDALPKLSLETPYENAEYQPTFWRFTESDTYLRPYLDTSFFGQWFYGLMVAINGLLNASQHSEEYYLYFEKHMNVLVNYYRYMQYDAAKFGDSTFLKRSVHTEDLDSIGTIGMNLYEFYVRQTDEQIKTEIRYIMERLAECVFTKIPRLEDDTFCRVDVMWADDTYMSCPFLVRMGNLTGDKKYYEEVVRQLKNYTQKMFMEDAGIYAHIYYVYEKRNNRVPWGRGNSWVYLTFAEVLEHLPADYSERKELEKLFVRAVEGLVQYQAPNGLWHQVLNMESSYLETSCTAIFSMALEKAIKLGVLDRETYLPRVKRAVNAIIENYIDEFGNVHNICRGSGCCDDAEYYAHLATVLNDAHGTGVVVSAISGLIELIKEGK